MQKYKLILVVAMLSLIYKMVLCPMCGSTSYLSLAGVVYFLLLLFVSIPAWIGLLFATALALFLTPFTVTLCFPCLLAHLCHVAYFGVQLPYPAVGSFGIVLILPFFHYAHFLPKVDTSSYPKTNRGYIVLFIQEGCPFCEVAVSKLEQVRFPHFKVIVDRACPDEIEGYPTTIITDQRGRISTTILGLSDTYLDEVTAAL